MKNRPPFLLADFVSKVEHVLFTMTAYSSSEDAKIMQVLSLQFAIVVVKCICEADVIYEVTNDKIGLDLVYRPILSVTKLRPQKLVDFIDRMTWG